jgi:heat shock protein HspQ
MVAFVLSIRQKYMIGVRLPHNQFGLRGVFLLISENVQQETFLMNLLLQSQKGIKAKRMNPFSRLVKNNERFIIETLHACRQTLFPDRL